MSSLFDTEDDVSLRTRRIAEDRPAGRERSVEVEEAADREVTLNTGTVLALFFTLALICAVFFGFGYSMGRKSNQAAPVAATTDSAAPEAAAAPVDTASSKPAPGSPAIQPIPGYLSAQEAEASNKTASSSAPRASATVASPTTPTTKPAVKVPVTSTATPAAPVVRTAPPAASPISTAPAAAGETYVQIAAVSHQEDADVLKSALGRRGYKVLERGDGNDHLIHVQIGPFTDRKAAEATRQKLLSDGYNAFLK